MARGKQKFTSGLPQHRHDGQIKQGMAKQHRQILKQFQVSCRLHPSIWLWDVDVALPILKTKKKKKKELDLWDQVPEANCPHFALGAHDQQLCTEQNQCVPTATSSSDYQVIENWHDPRILRSMTASPKPSLRTFWRVRDAAVGRWNIGQRASKGGRPMPTFFFFFFFVNAMAIAQVEYGGHEWLTVQRHVSPRSTGLTSETKQCAQIG